VLNYKPALDGKIRANAKRDVKKMGRAEEMKWIISSWVSSQINHRLLVKNQDTRQYKMSVFSLFFRGSS
jgi:hypothetical protein